MAYIELVSFWWHQYVHNLPRSFLKPCDRKGVLILLMVVTIVPTRRLVLSFLLQSKPTVNQSIASTYIFCMSLLLVLKPFSKLFCSYSFSAFTGDNHGNYSRTIWILVALCLTGYIKFNPLGWWWDLDFWISVISNLETEKNIQAFCG